MFQFDEEKNGAARLKIIIKGLAGIGLDAIGSDICIGLMPDQGKRARHKAIFVAAPTRSAPPRLAGILYGPPEGITQFHELPSAVSIGDEKRGDLMAEFTKEPFQGAAYEKRGIVKGVVLLSRAPSS